MRTFARKRKTMPATRSVRLTFPVRPGSGLRRKVRAILHDPDPEAVRAQQSVAQADGASALGPAGPRVISPAPLGIQRTIRGRVVSQRESDPRDAAACMVHLHPNEQNALEVAKDLRTTHCANLVFLEDTSGRSRPDRELQVEVTVGRPRGGRTPPRARRCARSRLWREVQTIRRRRGLPRRRPGSPVGSTGPSPGAAGKRRGYTALCAPTGGTSSSRCSRKPGVLECRNP